MKVAKLVAVSFLTRVIVEDNATQEQILEASKKAFRLKVENELDNNIKYIENDEVCPFDPEKDKHIILKWVPQAKRTESHC